MSGVQYLEPYKTYKLPLIYHAPLVFPGETLPMILPQNLFPINELSGDGVLFGLVSREVRCDSNTNAYGVTCQVYEKGGDNDDNVSFKSRAHQRFFIPSTEYVDPSASIRLEQSCGFFVVATLPSTSNYYYFVVLSYSDCLCLKLLILRRKMSADLHQSTEHGRRA